MRRKRREGRGPGERMRAQKERFGELVTADHLFRRDPDTNAFDHPEDVETFNYEVPTPDTCALDILDDATLYLGSLPKGPSASRTP